MANSSRPKDIHFTQRVAHFHIGEAGPTECLAFQCFDLENDGHDSSLKTLVVFLLIILSGNRLVHETILLCTRPPITSCNLSQTEEENDFRSCWLGEGLLTAVFIS